MRRIIRHKNNKKGERNVGTKKKSPKQDIASAKDLTIMFPGGLN